MNVRWLVLWLCFLHLSPIHDALGNGPVEENTVLEMGVGRIAMQVKSCLIQENLPLEIIVGDFAANPRLKVTTGAEIKRVLVKLLEQAGVSVSDDASQQLIGRFRVESRQFPDDDFAQLCLFIDTDLLDENGASLANFRISVLGPVASRLAGHTFFIPVNVTSQEKEREIARQFKEPPTKIEKQSITTCASSPFGIEVLVEEDGKKVARKAKLGNQGRAFVDLEESDTFVVQLHNQADFEVAVRLSVDGSNVVIDADGQSTDGFIIVHPESLVEVSGWYDSTAENSRKFSVSGQGKVGTITATFQACWNDAVSPPKDEQSSGPRCGSNTDQVHDTVSNVRLSRSVGALRSMVSVRLNREL